MKWIVFFNEKYEDWANEAYGSAEIHWTNKWMNEWVNLDELWDEIYIWTNFERKNAHVIDETLFRGNVGINLEPKATRKWAFFPQKIAIFPLFVTLFSILSFYVLINLTPF